MDNTHDITGSPSANDQSTQTEDVVDLTKEQSKENVSEEQGSILQSNSQNETEVWLFISFDFYLHTYFIKWWFFIIKCNTVMSVLEAALLKIKA